MGRIVWLIGGSVVAVALAAAIVLYRPKAAPELPERRVPELSRESAPAASARAEGLDEPQAAPAVNPDDALRAVSPSALWTSWLASGNVARRIAVVLDNVAEGVSPRKQLDVSLDGRFSTELVDGKQMLSAKSAQRYDVFARAIASIDAKAAAVAWRALHPAVEAAWRALGYPEASVDARAAEALARIVDAPVPPGRIELVEAGRLYIFADPALEALGPIEKQVIRMGPQNARRMQAKARELLSALRLGAAARR